MRAFHVYGSFLFSAVLSAQSLSFDLATVTTSALPQSVVTGDFNGDGKADLAVTGASSVEILLGNGDGTFRSAHVIALGAPATRIVKADFNLDGKLDLAVAIGNFGHVVVLLGNGDGSFQPPVDVGAQSPAEMPAPGVPCLAVGDVNGDGKPDLILGPYGSVSQITVMLGEGDGTFPQSVITTIDHVVDSPGVVVTDYNGDGRADLFIASTIQGELEQFGLLLGTASGQFTIAFWKTGDTGPAVATDINGNGKPDIVMSLGLGNNAGFFLQEYLDGSLTPVSTVVPIPADNYFPSFQTMAAADLDGDGKTDLLITASDGDMFPMLSNGDGTFKASPTIPSPASYLGGTSTVNLAADAYGSLAAADFFGAGRPSVIVALAGNSLVLLKNGAVDPPQAVPAGVVNAATATAIPAVPGSLMTILGSGLAYGSGARQAPSDLNFSSFMVPNRLFGMRVYGNGHQAGLLYASPNQANIQIPWEVAGQSQATLTITRNGLSQTVTVPVAAYAPGLFAMNQLGTGQAAAIVNTGEIAAPAGTFPGSRAIHRGEYLALFGTGLGPLDRMDLQDAEITPAPAYYYTNGGPLRNTTTTPLVTVGGVSATVQFSGFAPYMIGVYQVNILIPANAPAGNAVPIVLNIGGVASNTVTVAIQ
jgi:uncharacterized protein (TIGR03437 family)